MEKKDPIEEARRYVANAEEVIKKANYGGKHPVERLLGGHGCRVWHP